MIKKQNSGKQSNKTQWLTIGIKLILGITIASNLCIGALLFSNWQSTKEVKHHIDKLLMVQGEMSRNLREKIYELQGNYQQIPDFFKVDKMNTVREWLNDNYLILHEETLVGRDNYKSFYNRTGRRDLGKGRFVVRVDNGELFLSKGLVDDMGEFNDSVLRMRLASNQPEMDEQKINDFLISVNDMQMGADLFNQQLNAMKSYLADEALKAEETRNEILYRVEEIAQKEEKLEAVQTEKQRNSVIIGIVTIIINIFVLLGLTGTIIERPLRKLTMVIMEIQSGKSPIVPYLNRSDKIGILAYSIEHFRNAMHRLREEDERKSRETRIINKLINDISGLIRNQQEESRQMAEYASSLSDLALMTEDQSTIVTTSAENTARNSVAISDSTTELQAAIEIIADQIQKQKRLVSTISRETTTSRNNIDSLQEATEQILGITKIIKEITQKSKLLALNANIEAARYGKKGAGFMVVANEMKELSHQTEIAADDITSRTEAIYSAGQVFVNTIYDIEGKVSNLTEITGNIGKSIENQSSATSVIVENVRSTSSDSQDVSDRIAKVNKAAAETREMAAKVFGYSENITNALTGIFERTRETLQSLTTGEIDFDVKSLKN